VLGACSPSKNTYLLYEQQGRPLSVALNNAHKEVSKEWGISYKSHEYPVQKDLDEVMLYNDSVIRVMTKEWGKNWEEAFNKNIQQEFKTQETIRGAVMSSSTYKSVQPLVFELFILFEKQKKKKNHSIYLIHLVGQEITDETRKFVTLCQMKVKTNSPNKFYGVDCQKKPLIYTLPQNGIQ
jgi:hypothetical protein